MTLMDTDAVVKQLIAAGFSDQQAEAVTLVVRDAQDIDLPNLVTKTDLAATKVDLEKGMAAAKADLAETKSGLEKSIDAVKADLQLGLAAARSDLAETKAEILKWMISAIGAQTILILGAVIALVRLTGR